MSDCNPQTPTSNSQTPTGYYYLTNRGPATSNPAPVNTDPYGSQNFHTSGTSNANWPHAYPRQYGTMGNHQHWQPRPSTPPHTSLQGPPSGFQRWGHPSNMPQVPSIIPSHNWGSDPNYASWRPPSATSQPSAPRPPLFSEPLNDPSLTGPGHSSHMQPFTGSQPLPTPTIGPVATTYDPSQTATAKDPNVYFCPIVNHNPGANNPYKMVVSTQLSQQEIENDPKVASIVAAIGECQWFMKDLEQEKAGGCLSEKRSCGALFETRAEQLGRMSTRVKKVDPDEIGAKLFSSSRPRYRFIGFDEYQRLADKMTPDQKEGILEFNPYRTVGPSAYEDREDCERSGPPPGRSTF